jgi:large subunit ribosomal protein L15
MKLHDFRPAPGSRKSPKRVGRGPGSGLGKTSGRGHKGQKSRSGYSRQRGFEGGQMPLHRRLPKRGFTNIFRTEYRTINVERLGGFASGSVVDPESLAKAGLLAKGSQRVKVLGDGAIEVRLTVRAHKFTKSAVAKIEAAGGKVERIALRQPYRRPRRRPGRETPAANS